MEHHGNNYTGITVKDNGRGHFGNNHYTFHQYLAGADDDEEANSAQLSIPDAVRGLLSVSGQLCTNIAAFVVRVRDAPSLVQSVHVDVSAFRHALSIVSSILLARERQHGRTSFVPMDTIVVVLTDAVLLLDKIEQDLRPFIDCRKFGAAERRLWAKKEARIRRHVECIQWHKSTIYLQLNILKSDSTSDQIALRKQEDLLELVRSKLAQEKELAEGLAAVEARFEQRFRELMAGKREDPRTVSLREEARPTLDEGDVQGQPVAAVNLEGINTDLDHVLLRTRVYKRTIDRTEDDVSWRTASWRNSRLSALSLAASSDVSIMAFVALPICISDIHSGHHYFPGKEQNMSLPELDLESLDLDLNGGTNIVNSDKKNSQPNWWLTNGEYNLTHANEAFKGVGDALGSLGDQSYSISSMGASAEETSPSHPTVHDLKQNGVLFVCASLFEFSIEVNKSEGGYPYLSYAQGEVFDVYAQKGELWLAVNEDDAEMKVGWIWEQHFVVLSTDW